MTTPPAGVLLDLDGTVYQDDALVPGADTAIEALRRRDIGVRFVTNTTRATRDELVARLERLGVPARAEDVFTPTVTAASLLADEGVRRIALFLPKSSHADFEALEIVEEDPEAVVVGDLGPGWTFDAMNRAFRWLLGGARFVALHRNRYWKTGGELVLDAGAFVAAFEYATGREATLVGKPSRSMFAAAAASMDLELEEVAMVGDDVRSDVAGARDLGMTAFLVRTGKAGADPAAIEEMDSECVLDSLAALPDRLR